MKNVDRLFISVMNDYAEEHGVDGLLEELFPSMTVGEFLLDCYNAGLLPDDIVERFLEN